MYYTLHNVLLVKNNYILQNKTFIRSIVLFYTAPTVFNIWPDRRQLGPQVYFCIHSVMIDASGSST